MNPPWVRARCKRDRFRRNHPAGSGIAVRRSAPHGRTLNLRQRRARVVREVGNRLAPDGTAGNLLGLLGGLLNGPNAGACQYSCPAGMPRAWATTATQAHNSANRSFSALLSEIEAKRVALTDAVCAVLRASPAVVGAAGTATGRARPARTTPTTIPLGAETCAPARDDGRTEQQPPVGNSLLPRCRLLRAGRQQPAVPPAECRP